MKTEALFVTSAAAAHDLPADGTPELAVVGRSNVGKSTLINALTGLKLARTSATPGKTRLVNVFRVAGATARPFYLVDLPGFGYAKGSRRDVASFAAVTDAYFASLDPGGPARGMHQRRGGRRPGVAGAILLVDARHPGLANDVAAFGWLAALGRPAAVVATKIDKLTRAERSRAQQALDRAFHGPVLTVSAATGEGMKELWKLIDRLLSNQPPTLTSR